MPATSPASKVLRDVGWVLIGAEAVNLAWSLFGLFSGRGCSASVDLSVLVAGYFLVKGSLVAARYVAWFAAAVAAALVMMVLGWSLIVPVELSMLRFRLDPKTWVGALLVLGAIFALAMWVFVELRSKPVVEAQRSAGQKVFRAWTGFAAGGVFVLLVELTLLSFLSGENGRKAIQLAREQKGPGYRYALTSIHIADSNVTATVVAYDDRSEEDIEVQWKN